MVLRAILVGPLLVCGWMAIVLFICVATLLLPIHLPSSSFRRKTVTLMPNSIQLPQTLQLVSGKKKAFFLCSSGKK